MSFDVWNLIIGLLAILHVVQSRRGGATLHKHHKKLLLHPSKRVEIPHPWKKNEYIDSNSYRRQEVIHALNEDNKKVDAVDDDDIESLGTTIDASGNSVKKNVQNKTNKETIPKVPNFHLKLGDTNTKDIISKIKEIQDRIFKRTGSKELEEKLKQMSPLGLPEIKLPLTQVSPNSNLSYKQIESVLNSPSQKQIESVLNSPSQRNKSEDVVITKAREALRNEMKLSDGSKQAERRKIIPEEVVDKILEKFQQLRQEAKHMALLETQHGDSPPAPIKEDLPKGSSNPYASIGPAKENAEVKNRTQTGTDVTPIGLDKPEASSQPPDPPAQIPGTEPLNMASMQFPVSAVTDQQNKNNLPFNSQNGQKSISGIPLMFIKNGQMLVPVFDNSQSNSQSPNPNPMTITGNGLAQLNSNIGVALPSFPNNIIPMNSIPQPITSSFINSPSQPPQKQPMTFQNSFSNQNSIANSLDMIKNQQVNPATLQAMLYGMLSKATSNYAPAPTFNQGGLSRCGISGESCASPTSESNTFNQGGLSRCGISGESCASPTSESNTQPMMQSPQTIPQYRDMNENSPATAQLINQIMSGTPGLSQLAAAAKFITDFGHNKPMTGDQRSFGNNVPTFPTRPSMMSQQSSGINNQRDVESINPANIQFSMQQNLARNNPNNEVPMPMENQEQPFDIQKTIMQLNQPPKLSSLPIVNSPYENTVSNFMKQQRDNQIDGRQSQIFNDKHADTNDISDPPPQDQNENNKFNSDGQNSNSIPNIQDPDELLEIAKMKSLQRNLPEDEVTNPVANIDENGMDPTHMTSENGNTEKGMMNVLNGVDPSSLLDKLHGAQLKSDLLGPGDPRWFSPTFKDSVQRVKTQFGASPDDLLEMLRKQNGQMFHKGFDSDRGNNMEFDRSRYREENAKMRERVPFGIDPSLADEIPDNEGTGQHFDVQNKDLVDNRNNNNLLNKDNFVSSHGPISVLSDGLVQYKHGRMSMDSSSIVNSFLQDQQTYRNEIAHPRNGTNDTKPIVRATISKTFPEDNIELRINGKKLPEKSFTRSKIVNGSYPKIQGRTISSKSPIKVELSHGKNKRKIINIVTQGRYNVTDDKRKRKRTKILRPTKIVNR